MARTIILRGKEIKLISDVVVPLFKEIPRPLRECDILGIQWEIFKETGCLVEENLVLHWHALYWNGRETKKPYDRKDER